MPMKNAPALLKAEAFQVDLVYLAVFIWFL
jgi:hypothetical protein